MEKILYILQSSIDDIKTLLALSRSAEGSKNKSIIYRSAIVLLVASWEQFIEQLAVQAIIVLTNRLRKSNSLPEGVKQGISIFEIPENRSNKNEFSNKVWGFSDNGWKRLYSEYSKDITSKLNTASPRNIRDLYKNILGIRDITIDWKFEDLDSDQCSVFLNNIIEIRHDIAHGENKISPNLDDNSIVKYISFISKISEQTLITVSNETAIIYSNEAIEYSLNQSCYVDIIELGVSKNDGLLSLKEIKGLGSSAQGNHNKLCYEPWSLLEKRGRYTRKVTKRMMDFYGGSMKLPYEILVFDNGESIPKPGTDYLSFLDLKTTR